MWKKNYTGGIYYLGGIHYSAPPSKVTKHERLITRWPYEPYLGYPAGYPKWGSRGVPRVRGTPRGPAGYPPYEPRVRAGYVAGYPTALGYPAGYPATKSRVRNGVPRYEP